MKTDHEFSQLTLPILPRTLQTWANFAVGANAQLVSALRDISTLESKMVLLVGTVGAGKSHVLNAILHSLVQQGHQDQVLYWDLQQLADNYQGLEYSEPRRVNLIDNVHALAGNLLAEKALFAIVERARANGEYCIVSSGVPMKAAQFELQDLVSRITAGLQFSIQPLSDQELSLAVQLRFASFGVNVGGAVSDYIVNRYSREPHQLFAAIDALDSAAFERQRRLTIPFVRDVLQL